MVYYMGPSLDLLKVSKVSGGVLRITGGRGDLQREFAFLFTG